ncbi:optic atrophy 3 protein homolog [Lingula anatina]|uniref:Optic atrophy 3 protein homolog n=1 Tax=Lingula anatina TaxID=7574 RepID=A0A1S3IR83_LINAN|nr:optic atrophy 3 protein homolog [Lingula anatina]|eukprot:XP_013400039.1 optic atrophy 3 protein homolog [Lingula anatina]
MAVFPLIKLVTLSIRQLSKPIANQIKIRAKNHEKFRGLLKWGAQKYHRIETTSKLKLMGIKSTKEVKPLNEEMAVELGADMLGEIFIWSVAVAMIGLESYRQSSKSTASREAVREDLEDQIQALEFKLEEQDTKIRELMRLSHHLETELTTMNKTLTDVERNTRAASKTAKVKTAKKPKKVTSSSLARQSSVSHAVDGAISSLFGKS